MALVDVINSEAQKVSEVELADAIFDVPVKGNILHDVVVMQLASRRAGTASVKHRSDIKGSRRKLFRQKGTGRARRGDIKSPLLRGGGSVFGPDPKSYAYRVPKKVRRLALKMALSSKLKEEKIVVMDRFDLDHVKTKAFVQILNRINAQKPLIVISEKNETLELSSRNVPGVKVLRTEGLNVYDILKHDQLILMEASIQGIEGRFRNDAA
ncbi:MAG: 50S ribosomal protein L4 [Desulfobacterales bacterium]